MRQIVLSKLGRGWDGVHFRYTPAPEEKSDPGIDLRMRTGAWEEMGKPSTVTLVVEPGEMPNGDAPLLTTSLDGRIAVALRPGGEVGAEVQRARDVLRGVLNPNEGKATEMTWQTTITGHTSGPLSKESEADVLDHLRAVVQALKDVDGNQMMSATVSTQHHGYVDLIGPRDPEELRTT